MCMIEMLFGIKKYLHFWLMIACEVGECAELGGWIG